MGKTLVLAEKPSVGRDLARVLNCKQEKNGYIEGSNYIVTWALGHLVTLAETEIYSNKYKNWDINDLPILPKYLKTIVIKKTSKQFNTVKAQLNRNDVEQIVIATDAGREGELVARWIIDKAQVKKPIKRLWISSSTDKAIKEGFNKLKDGKEYENLYSSALARAEADWLVGINATRALTTKYNAQLSCGRVQTPAVNMIYKRELEIQNFKPKEFYGIASKSYKFQTSMALILPALYKKIYDEKVLGDISFEKAIEMIQKAMLGSFIEDPHYTASSTNSKEIKKLVNSFGKGN